MIPTLVAAILGFVALIIQAQLNHWNQANGSIENTEAQEQFGQAEKNFAGVLNERSLFISSNVTYLIPNLWAEIWNTENQITRSEPPENQPNEFWVQLLQREYDYAQQTLNQIKTIAREDLGVTDS